MTKITPTTTARTTPRQSPGWQDTGSDEEAITPLTAQQAQQWRQRHPQLSVLRVLVMQVMVGVVVVAVTWLLTGSPQAAKSAAYGALVGIIPAALAAKGTARWAAPGFTPGAALAGLLVWEAVKLVLAAGLLMAAPKFLGVPNWPALLIGLALTIKVYWVGLLLAQSMKSNQGQVQKVQHGS